MQLDPQTLVSSYETEALVLLHGLREAPFQDLFGLVAGHVQQVVAGVGHGQVVLLGRRGLDDDFQALHAVNGDAVAARQEHYMKRTSDQLIGTVHTYNYYGLCAIM